MPAQVAHDAVRVGLDVGRDVLTFSKSKRLLRPTIELLERPVCAVVTSKAGLVTLAACDRLVSAVDRTIDRVMTTSVYKCAVRAVAHNSARTGAWRRRALERYYAMLLRADALVDLYLPPANASKDSVKQPTLVIMKRGVSGLATKVARRGHARIRAAVASASLAVKKSPGVFKNTMVAAVARVKAIPSILCAESLAIGKTIEAQCFAAAGAADQLALRYATTSFLRNLAVSVYQCRISPLVARLLSPAAQSNPTSFVRQDALRTPARFAPPPRRPTYIKDDTSKFASGESTPVPESKSQRPGRALLLTPSGDSPLTRAWKVVGLTTPDSPVADAAAVATAVPDGDARSAPRPRRPADSNALLKRAVAGAASTPAPTVPARESSPAPESETAALLKVDSSLFFSPGLESAHRQAWKSVGLTTPGMPVQDAAAVATPEPDGDACGSPVTPYTPLYLLNM
jgi:hypothetical protein